jgi:hypothetical protein
MNIREMPSHLTVDRPLVVGRPSELCSPKRARFFAAEQ